MLLHTIASFYYISKHNITFDEPDYIEFAKRWLHGKPERIKPLDDSKSPVIAIAWLPRMVRQTINPTYQLNDYGRQDQKEGRYMMILFSLLTGLYVYKWCNELYGGNFWILPLILLLFDPLFLSYSTLLLTDLACGAILLATLYHYRKYLISSSRKQFYISAIFCGVGIVTKQTLVFLLLLLPLLSILYHALINKKRIRWINTFRDAVIVVLIMVLVINIAYYFHNSFMPLGSYVFESESLQQLQNSFKILSGFPVPLPQSYVQSIDMLKAHAEIGAGKIDSTFNGVYLFNVLKITGGFWYYYIVLFLHKMPIGTLLLMSGAVVLFFRNFRRSSFANKYLFLVVPVLFYWFILSFVNQFQTGIRHFLLALPLLYIGLGYLFKKVSTASLKYKIVTAIAISYTFVSIAFYYPYIIAYTNEFIVNKATAYRKISDSSINYGQSDSSINKFLAENPTYQKASQIPKAGKFIVGMNQVCDTYLPLQNPYAWYNQLEPTGHFKYVFILYEVKADDLRSVDLSLRYPKIK